jgi:hypothetical protein
MSVSRARALARLAILGALALPSPASAAPARFAVVIGNNRAEPSSRDLTLRYADDDAAATHRLLREAGVHSVLLTTFDADSERMANSQRADGPASWAELARVLDGVFAKMRGAEGGAELFLFYSGHGDVAHGEGYVVLEDRRLTRRMLYQLLARSPARRNHVVIDACKSYFLAFERGPGGERSDYGHSFDDAQVPGALANTGFVLSTSSDRDSHEWERYGAGIFSHEVRSALRGGADLDGNGRISYVELGAFLATANEGIRNRRFRPEFAIRPPARALDTEMLAWPAGAGLTVGGELGHLYVETSSGERLLDAHVKAGQTLTLRLPAERPLFVRRGDDSGEYTLLEPALPRLAELTPHAASASRKGALHMAFEQLFAVPFGPASMDGFSARHSEGERLLASAQVRERSRRITRQALGWTTLGLLAAGAALTAVAIERSSAAQAASQVDRVQINETLNGLAPGIGVAFGVAAATGVAWVTTTVRWR